MQGKSKHENKGSHYFISTGKMVIRGLFDDGSSRLLAVVDGERLLSIPRRCTAFECLPDRKVEYETMCTVSATRQETPDPTPVEVGIPLERPRTLAEEMKRFIREEISQAAEVAQAGSWEDEDDFEIDEDPSPISEYELDEMQEEELVSDYDPEKEPPAASAEAPAPDTPLEEPAALAVEPEPQAEAAP